ncbi:MAG: hypothetical protein B7X55_02225 [Rhodobacterales bacterium 34-62-10]|nr:MAG: hypothetical protein B7X55_02225 [Rhodobacterales bacterium 34-62-10]
MSMCPASLLAQTADPTELKRRFLDRYLDCAEAPSDAARLACFDRILIDIPAWLNASPDPCLVPNQPSANDPQTKGTASQKGSD